LYEAWPAILLFCHVQQPYWIISSIAYPCWQVPVARQDIAPLQ